jgi:hypothetical protein
MDPRACIGRTKCFRITCVTWTDTCRCSLELPADLARGTRGPACATTSASSDVVRTGADFDAVRAAGRRVDRGALAGSSCPYRQDRRRLRFATDRAPLGGRAQWMA